MRVTQAQIAREELLCCKTWEEFQWIMLWLRIMKSVQHSGILI